PRRSRRRPTTWWWATAPAPSSTRPSAWASRYWTRTGCRPSSAAAADRVARDGDGHRVLERPGPVDADAVHEDRECEAATPHRVAAAPQAQNNTERDGLAP